MITSARPGRACLLLILLFVATFQSASLNGPFQRDSEGCGAFYGILARNYFRYDLSRTHGIPVMSMGAGAEPIFYANHPPITPLLIAAVYAITGYRGGFDQLPGDWQTRLPTALFTIGCVGLIYAMVKRRAAERVALLAAAMFAALPITLIFGGLPEVIGPQLLFFVMLAVTAYEKFHERSNWRSFGVLICAFTGAGIIDWPAYYLVPVLGLHFICTRKIRDWPWIIGFGIFSVILFVLIYSHLTTGQDDWKWMLHQFQKRSASNTSDGSAQFTLAQWIRHAIWEMAVPRLSIVAILLGLAWIPTAITRRFSHRADRLIGLLLGWSLLHILLGRQGLYQHEWWWFPIAPSLAIAAAMVVDRVLESLSRSLDARKLNAAAIFLVMLFAVWNVTSALVERANAPRIAAGELNYSLREIGQVIREHTPPDQVALLTESDASLAFWSYADRAVKRKVWDLGEFQKRLNDDTIEISFDKWVSSKSPPGSMIIPRAYLNSVVPPLVEYLDAHYPRTDLPKFVVYDLGSGPR